MEKRPLVLCLTNTVAANFTANCLLAIGARPAMVEDRTEAEDLAARADAVLVNLGMVTARQADAMRAAVAVTQARSRPWVLDPVGVDMLDSRRRLAMELISLRPTLIRANANEIGALTGTVPDLTRRTTVLSTGVVDRVVDNSGEIEVTGGVPMLQMVTATGCAQGGLCAAFLGRGQTPREACIFASKLMKRAGEVAWGRTKAPGSFQLALIDALWELGHD